MRGLLQIPPRYGGLLGDVETPLVDPRLAVNEKAPPRVPGMVTAPVPGMTGRVPARAPTAVERLMRGLGSGAGNLLAGADDPNLSAEQNKRARDAAIIRAGLAMMAAGGQGASLGEVLAGGALAGQEAGAQSRGGMAQDASRARMQEIVASGAGVPELRQMFQQAVLMGDTQAMQSIGVALQAAEATERERAVMTPSVIREGGRDFPNTPEGAEAALAWAKARAEATRNPLVDRGFDPETDPVVQRAIAMRDMGLRSTGGGTEDERKAAAFAGFVPEHIEFIDNFAGAPGRVSQALSDRGLREFNDAEQQQLQLSGAAMAEAWLRMTTGAAYNDREFDNAYNLFVPRPGDRKETLDMKRRNREKLKAMLTTRAGRVAVPEPSTPPAPQYSPDNPFRPQPLP